MDLLCLAFQVIITGVLLYIILRLFEMDFRIYSVEKALVKTVPVESTVKEDLVLSELSSKILIEPQHFDSSEDLSTRLRKLSITRLSEIAAEKNVSTVDQDGKKLSKKSLIREIVSASNV